MTIYTDGSAHPNPGPGGFGVIVLNDKEELIEVYSKQFSSNVTNNEMEIKAILYAFLKYGKKETDFFMPTIYSDSSYCINTFTNWIFTWAKNDWKKSDKKAPENLELIKAFFDRYLKGYRIEFQKVKGHNNNKWNELADQLATGKLTPEEIWNKYNKGEI